MHFPVSAIDTDGVSVLSIRLNLMGLTTLPAFAALKFLEAGSPSLWCRWNIGTE
jgi:hypothetical protein